MEKPKIRAPGFAAKLAVVAVAFSLVDLGAVVKASNAMKRIERESRERDGLVARELRDTQEALTAVSARAEVALDAANKQEIYVYPVWSDRPVRLEHMTATREEAAAVSNAWLNTIYGP